MNRLIYHPPVKGSSTRGYECYCGNCNQRVGLFAGECPHCNAKLDVNLVVADRKMVTNDRPS